MRYLAAKNSVTLKTGLGVVQDHWKWRRSIDHIRLSIGRPLSAYLCVIGLPFSSYLTLNNRDLEIRVIDHWKSSKLVPFERLGAVSYLSSTVTMALSCISSEIKPNIGRKSLFFHTPLHSAPPVRGSPLEYCHPVWCGNTRVVGLLGGKKNWRV